MVVPLIKRMKSSPEKNDSKQSQSCSAIMFALRIEYS